MTSLNRQPRLSTTRVFALSRQGLVVQFGEQGGLVLLSGSANLYGAVLTPNLRYDASWSEVHVEATKEDAPARVQVYGIFRAHVVLLDAARAELHAELDVMRRDAHRAHAAARAHRTPSSAGTTQSAEAEKKGAASSSGVPHVFPNAQGDPRIVGSQHMHSAFPHAALSSSQRAGDVMKGPRVLVLGSDHNVMAHTHTRSASHSHPHGSSDDTDLRSVALCRDLINAAVRDEDGAGGGIIYLDVDVHQPSCGHAGSVSAIFVQETVTQVHGLESFMPFSFFLGESTVTTASRRRYLDLCAALQQAVWSVVSSERGSWGRAGGCVIRASALATPELTRDVWMELISLFDVTHVVMCERGLAAQQLVESVTVGRAVRVRCYCPDDVSAGLSGAEGEGCEDDSDAARSGCPDHVAGIDGEEGECVTRGAMDDAAAAAATPSDMAMHGSQAPALSVHSGGVHTSQGRAWSYRVMDTDHLVTAQMVRYFMGTPRAPLTPYRGLCSVADVTFADALTLQPLAPTSIRARSLAAVVWANSATTLADANVAGYLVLLDVGHKYFTFLSPAPGALPKPYILVSPSIVMPPEHIPPLSSMT